MEPTAPTAPPATHRRPSGRARALVAASITGAVAVAGIASAGGASAAELKSDTAVRTLSPAVTTAIKLPVPFPPGSCYACGLGGFDPTIDGPYGPFGL
jgi:hypothetical protein